MKTIQPKKPGGAHGSFPGNFATIHTGGALPNSELGKTGKIEFFTKTVFFIIQVGIEEAWGCPGGAHRAYEDIPSNFGRISLYMGSESPLFNTFRQTDISMY